MAHIMVMPPQVIIIGMPMFIIASIRWQHSMNMSFMESSIGIISHFMPLGVIVQCILHIITAIGIMPLIIGIMPPIGIGIMPLIIGMFIGIGMLAVIFGFRLFGVFDDSASVRGRTLNGRDRDRAT